MVRMPTLKRLPALTIVGLRVRTRPMSAQISKVWDDFVPRMGEIAYRAEPDVSYGVIGHWDPATQQFDYQAGVAVTDARTVQNGMVRWEVLESDWAVFDATIQTLGEVFEQVPAQLRALGVEQIEGPTLERYGPDFTQPQQPLQVWVPVARRDSRPLREHSA